MTSRPEITAPRATTRPRATFLAPDQAATLPPARAGPMLLFDFVAPDTAVAIEQPWLRVMQKFPPALFRHRFGT